jgi:DNA repair protein RecN (Recombination protein N)
MLSCAQLSFPGLCVLLELRLENYAVIDHLAVQFAPGLNLLSGETGAGKSILIDALALLMGEKASPEVIRFGSDRAVISAVFEVDGAAEQVVAGILENNGIDSDETNLILRREIAAKGRVFVNNQPATVAVLKQLAPHLAGIHAQNESLVSFDPGVRLELLDNYANTQLAPVKESFEKWKQVKDRISELEQGEHDRLRLVDLWMFQRREIEDAKIQPGEDERMEIQKRVLANAEKIYNSAMHAFDLLYEGTASTSASLRTAQKHLEELIRYEPKFQEALASLDTARISVEDVGASLRDYAGSIEASPERLAEIEDRLALLDRFKRKYGPTLEDVVNLGGEVARKLSEIENKDEILSQLHAELATAADSYLQSARAVSKKRYEAAKKLEKIVEAEINGLAMKSQFRIEVSGTDAEENWTASGFDQVEYMISTNSGEPMHPLDQIASGGELSRVMLALKASVEAGTPRNKKTGAQRTLIFDEIDTGIGGRAAEAVGKRLKSLSRSTQVLCVTHLPQIATFADHHYLIEKKKAGDRMRTTVREIADDERTEEIARMLSGAKVSETSLKHAEQMLKANA